MYVPFPNYGLSNSCDIQKALWEYNLGVTHILILLQELSSCCLCISVFIGNVSVVKKWHNWFLYIMYSYTYLNLLLGFYWYWCLKSAVHVISLIQTRIRSLPKTPTLFHKIRVAQLWMQPIIYTNIIYGKFWKSYI